MQASSTRVIPAKQALSPGPAPSAPPVMSRESRGQAPTYGYHGCRGAVGLLAGPPRRPATRPKEMGSMEWLNLLMRWLHLVSVAVLIGSAAFMVVVLRPALADRTRESRRDFFLSLKIRLKMLVPRLHCRDPGFRSLQHPPGLEDRPGAQPGGLPDQGFAGPGGPGARHRGLCRAFSPVPTRSPREAAG